MSIDEMHRWARAGDLTYCTICGAGSGDIDITCPITIEKQKERYAREQAAKRIAESGEVAPLQ